ncbi:MAG TPA: prepilin-type cleavage/methylation domain-containing protein, partial [Oxalobacteraceae bacterium]|nr:prepilin-type cleavage/methylation domain-containing protein [Oxalobacteraceae bacterium]
LVEIAIVLVIIGLLLGGVLKGQEMIEGAKVKNAIIDINGVSAAYNSYLDRFKALPGDDGPTATLQARGGAWTSITAGGNANGVILIPVANVFNPAAESLSFWQAVKAAGFISGNPSDVGVTALPPNAFNGKLGVGTGVTPAVGTAAFSVCLSQVPGKSARAIDVRLDDAQSNKGSVLATLGVINTNTAPGVAVATYSDDNQYTVCKAL